jgi:hypothetical protein
MNEHINDTLGEFERELIRRERQAREHEQLWRMTKTERATLLLAGGMTRRQLAAWRERHPSEIPSPARIREAQEAALWRMTAAERVAAMEAGRLTQYQLFAWSQRRPYEVPLIDGELAWIVYRTADWMEATEGRRPRRQLMRCESTGESLLECDCEVCEAARDRAVESMRAHGMF